MKLGMYIPRVIGQNLIKQNFEIWPLCHRGGGAGKTTHPDWGACHMHRHPKVSQLWLWARLDQVDHHFHNYCVLLCMESATELRHYISSNCVNPAQTHVYVLRLAATIMSSVLTGILLVVPFLSLPPLFGIVCLAISVACLLSHLS